MPTINSWNSNIPVELSKGGTNATSMATSTGIVKYDGTRLVTSSTALIDSSNRTTNTSQPCFRAYANLQSDVTGDGTEYTVIFAHENFDQANNFDATSTFTVPVTGIYCLYVNLWLSGVLTAHTLGSLFIKNGVNVVSKSFVNLFDLAQSNGQATMFNYTTANLTAADTLTVRIVVSGSTKVVDIAANTDSSYFGGFLIC